MGPRNGLGILEMKNCLDTAGSRTFGCPGGSVVTIVTVDVRGSVRHVIIYENDQQDAPV